ncbi:thiamine-phosphate kinase [Rhodococcus fascians]|nr:thiamine-phosphate kinase [Rhodococcus fascians]MBY4236626.1 thiamine-phosphate kinase [Rhodococcus fascians]MBY4252008.1 thiamine-phosphate kinase [Rhodococcus fascians]MBY4267970.1 thiamine-phosphate kinase [Rhodococcus fascians]
MIDDTGPSGTTAAEPTVAQIGEFDVIARAVADRVQPTSTIVGPGDDAAVVSASDGRVAATTDMLVHGRHFRLDWSTPVEIGRKAIAQNGADIAAMGGQCSAFLVALGCPADTPVSVTDGLNEGMWREASAAGSAIVGGDVVQSDQLVISITALGDLQGRAPVLRSGAQIGDVIAFAGRLGWSAAGLALLLAGDDRSGHDAVLDAHRVPAPPYRAGIEAAEAGATSLTDVSDGLSADLGHIADASGVSMVLEPERLPIADEVRSAAELLGVDPLEWVLTGGEDHALVGTFPGLATVPTGWIVIGRVEPASNATDGGVTVTGHHRVGRSGWSSFDRE